MGCKTTPPTSMTLAVALDRVSALTVFSALTLLSIVIPTNLDAAVQSNPEVQRLFSTDEPLVFTLEADFDRLKKDRDQESEERDGRIVLRSAGGESVTVPILVKTRGNFRLQKANCAFPPLRLNLPEEGLEGTVLEGQDKLKLVTHCRENDRYEQNVVEEYLAYRIFNLFTDVSFQTRLAQVTYVDSRGEDDPDPRIAFILEDEDAMAARLNGTMLEVPAVGADDYYPTAAGQVYLFQYLIGNEDWSVTHFHNIKLMRVGMDHYPVPYDFDWSGLVDAPYATPHLEYAEKIDSVRDRLFCGSCSDRIDYGVLFAKFNGQREAIMNLVASQTLLSERNIESAQGYIEDFYEILNDERKARLEILNACIRG